MSPQEERPQVKPLDVDAIERAIAGTSMALVFADLIAEVRRLRAEQAAMDRVIHSVLAGEVHHGDECAWLDPDADNDCSCGAVARAIQAAHP